MNRDNNSSNFEIKIRIGRNQIRMSGEFPQENVNLMDLLPNLYPLANVIVEAAVAEQDKAVSCRMGCSACCSQLVPINPAEAHYLTGILAQIPQSHRDRVQRRLDKAIKKINRHPELYAYLQHPSQFDLSREEIQKLGMEYFSLKLDCPFLKNNRCSIYAYRPLACREYLVSSDPRFCETPNQHDVDCIPIPKTLSSILYRFADGKGQADKEYLSLIMFQEYSRQHPLDELISLPGKDFLTNIIQALAS